MYWHSLLTWCNLFGFIKLASLTVDISYSVYLKNLLDIIFKAPFDAIFFFHVKKLLYKSQRNFFVFLYILNPN